MFISTSARMILPAACAAVMAGAGAGGGRGLFRSGYSDCVDQPSSRSISSAVGETPLIHLASLSKLTGCKCQS